VSLDLATPLSLYLHIPFCRSRCTYCDFNAYAGLDELISRYALALAEEVRLTVLARPVHTLYFGGGTPSLTPLDDLAPILAVCRESFDVMPDAEITLEANPGTVSPAYLVGLRRLGINRLSLGVQSVHQSELNLFDRVHTFAEAAEAVRWARAAGLDNLNLDLIYGVPGQTMAMWQQSLEETLALEPDHLSAYALSLEFGTPMQAWVQRGLLPAPDSGLAADMYEWASERLEASGFVQYEISNWARGSVEAHASRHNLQYWRNLPYLGFGAGAHGYADGWRYSVVRSPRAYIERIETGGDEPRHASALSSPAVAERHEIDRETEMGETMMMGMRLTGEGVRDCAFRARFGLGLADRYGRELRRLESLKLIEWDSAGARLTRGGRLLANRVFREFV
jgi:oxygen-independent coproporphyrinogen-3 oxidase